MPTREPAAMLPGYNRPHVEAHPTTLSQPIDVILALCAAILS